MEITFQNRREDFAEFYSHMARDTEEGSRIGQGRFAEWLLSTTAGSFVVGVMVGSATGSGIVFCGLPVILFLCLNGLLLLLSRGKPVVMLARNTYKNQERHLRQKDLEVFLLPKRLEADDETLTISSRESLHRWRWRVVERVDLTANCLFIHVGACPVVYLPRRDFASEQEFVEAGKALEALRAANLGKLIGGE
jgi:hypothetical protein